VKVVLDTNVIVSALIARGTPYYCLLALKHKIFALIYSKEIIDELSEVLERKFRWSEDEINKTVSFIQQIGHQVETTGTLQVIEADPDDNIIIETAMIGEADLIVSGDRHLIKMGQYEGIEVVTPAEFLKRLFSILFST